MDFTGVKFHNKTLANRELAPQTASEIQIKDLTLLCNKY